MNKQYDVAALGELLIDFTENGTSGQGNPVYEANPGGAPCNVLSMLNKLGHRTAFLGKVGNDIFGRQLRAAVESAGIDVSGLLTDEDVRTTLAFVETKPDGDRDFSFYRNPGADMMLREDEVRHDIIADAKIFHFGTLSMTNEPVRSATRHAIKVAKENGAILSFDPNIREPLWKDMEDARTQMAYGLSVCDILKISDNEIQWFPGKKITPKGSTCCSRPIRSRSSFYPWERTEAELIIRICWLKFLHFYRKTRSKPPVPETPLGHAACTIY